MNFKSISFFLGIFCFPISLLSFINILYSSYFDYFLSVESYIATLVISLFFGSGLCFFGKKSKKKINFIEQLILIILVYFITGLLISIPFYLSNFKITFLSALFEYFWIDWYRFSIFENIKFRSYAYFVEIIVTVDWRSLFSCFLLIIFSNKSFNFKMTSLTYTGESNIVSEEI